MLEVIEMNIDGFIMYSVVYTNHQGLLDIKQFWSEEEAKTYLLNKFHGACINDITVNYLTK